MDGGSQQRRVGAVLVMAMALVVITAWPATAGPDLGMAQYTVANQSYTVCVARAQQVLASLGYYVSTTYGRVVFGKSDGPTSVIVNCYQATTSTVYTITAASTDQNCGSVCLLNRVHDAIFAVAGGSPPPPGGSLPPPTGWPATSNWADTYGSKFTVTVDTTHTVRGCFGETGYPAAVANGSLRGTVSGNVFQGVYLYPNQKGWFKFYLSGDGQHFDGTYLDSNGGGGAWCGDRNVWSGRTCQNLPTFPPPTAGSGC